MPKPTNASVQSTPAANNIEVLVCEVRKPLAVSGKDRNILYKPGDIVAVKRAAYGVRILPKSEIVATPSDTDIVRSCFYPNRRKYYLTGFVAIMEEQSVFLQMYSTSFSETFVLLEDQTETLAQHLRIARGGDCQ